MSAASTMAEAGPNLRKNTGNAGKGRPKGVPNKVQAAVKDMVLQALSEAHEEGGVAYLKDQATKNPTAFLTLVGKVIPLQVSGDPDNPLIIHRIELVAPASMAKFVAPQLVAPE